MASEASRVGCACRILRVTPPPALRAGPSPCRGGIKSAIASRSCLIDSIFKQPTLRRPYSLRRRVRRRLFPSPSNMRGWRADRRVLVNSRTVADAWRLSARHGGVVQRPVRAFRRATGPHLSASSSRPVLVPGGGGRRRPRAWRVRSSPARGHRILLHHQTPHDSALNRAGRDQYKGAGRGRG